MGIMGTWPAQRKFDLPQYHPWIISELNRNLPEHEGSWVSGVRKRSTMENPWFLDVFLDLDVGMGKKHLRMEHQQQKIQHL